MRGFNWILRPLVSFATTSMATTVLHELMHASVAYALGVRSTLLNYSVDLDLTPAQAATDVRALISIAGPLFCLGLGTAAWIAFKRARGSATELPLLYFAVFGVGTFFGNLMSAAFVGDFSVVATAWQLPVPARYALSLAGAFVAAAVHFWAGRELARWVPPTAGRVGGMLGIIAVPVILGTAGVILVNLPSVSAANRAAEASFWLFAAMGTLVAGHRNGDGHETSRVRWFDAAALLAAILTVRLLVRGIPFEP